jgi:hypothetical protein
MSNTFLFIALCALAVLGVFSGCSSTQPPACNPDAPVGHWETASSDGGSYELTLNADGSCSYTGTKSDGNPVGYTCTWTASDGNITFVLSDGSTDSPQPYGLVDGDLVIGETTWVSSECGGVS